MPKQNLIMTRMHPIAEKRFPQLSLNALAAQGGRGYVNARLWRAPNESSLSWEGSANGGNAAAMVAAAGMTGSFGRTSGRRDRTACVSDAARIVSKIDGYLFSRDAERPGVDEAWALNVDGTQTDIRSFWKNVSSSLTTGQWLWLQADRGAGSDEPSSVLSRAGDVPRWTLWPATSVPDWHFDSKGRLLWLITAGETHHRDNPMEEPSTEETRTLWLAGTGGAPASYVQYIDAKDDENIVASGTLSAPDLPFVLVGKPSTEDYWYDTVENLQALLTNLTSLHDENLIRTVYPQLVISQSMLQGIEARLIERQGSSNGSAMVEVVREIVRGLDSPFVESAEDKNITRFLQPSASDLAALPDEIDRVRKALYESVGLTLTEDSRQVASAETHAWNHLDVATTIRDRALTLQAAEEKLVGVTKSLDSSWPGYSPVWPTEFGIEREIDVDTKDQI